MIADPVPHFAPAADLSKVLGVGNCSEDISLVNAKVKRVGEGRSPDMTLCIKERCNMHSFVRIFIHRSKPGFQTAHSKPYNSNHNHDNYLPLLNKTPSMPLFKSIKKQTSANSTSNQTPRPSLNDYRPLIDSQAKTTPEQALKKLSKQGATFGMSGNIVV
ncbi:hypothetical protein EMPS_03391 [Entomortierella parvispora]|uniref:Uncharacterized protein n=1 Tax=Entomortierella parvispora TaxID=205924 RepID=A0A9P3H6P6_9FUNG|nr:hypothetical protein EMPS_03391 [Entomortierella parvispora]